MGNIVMLMILLVPTGWVFLMAYTLVTGVFEDRYDPDRRNRARTRMIGLTTAVAVVIGGWYVVMNIERWNTEAAQRAYERNPSIYYPPASTSTSTSEAIDDTYVEDEPSECGYGGWGC
ncbi:hypothetical protein [Deinococcus maricopensis]|uniref:Uncharacterized protein n=1 Tax=Deinococcus maricopensis (strain DSM 21211 / LMG 22137 / NRRL B-23946 / LB-34) TaxID=709986 RepID=E8U621_DEIML|nr:hypothetical protein [Deinococcus maricopensis]ADV66510.1 hypothetical protein Deima_0855 [Deinococcus maricopensis DSM 21211]